MTDYDIDGLTTDYLATLNRTDIPHQKCIVLFSGIPGSGKTTVAQTIESELEAIRISNDDIRDLIIAKYPHVDRDERERVKLAVATRLLQFLITLPNGRLVFDVSCDRPGGFDFYNSWALKNDYRIILMRLEVPYNVAKKRILERGNVGYRNVERLLANMNIRYEEWEEFGNDHKPDLVINVETNKQAILETILTEPVRSISD